MVNSRMASLHSKTQSQKKKEKQKQTYRSLVLDKPTRKAKIFKELNRSYRQKIEVISTLPLSNLKSWFPPK
jgi:hypothetical protein